MKKIQTLNIGTTTVELAEYELTGKSSLTLARYGVTRLDAPLDFETAGTILGSALLALARETGIHPGPVALAIPGQSVFTKFAAVARAGGNDRFEQMIRYEIEQGIPLPIDEMICDRQVLGETESGDASVMIVAAKTDQVEALTNAVASVGFVPTLVDSAPGALTNAVRFLHPESAEACTITLWLASRATSLIITEGDKVYSRLIPIGASTISREIATACGCSIEEADQLRVEKGYVAMGGVTEDSDEVSDRVSKACRAVMTRLNAEISRSVNFYRSQQQGGTPEKVYLTGMVALLPQVDEFFADALGLEVEFLNPFDRVGVGERVDVEALETDAAYLAATVGLAAQSASLSRYTINLLPPSLIAERTERARVPFIAAAGIGLVAAVALFALGVNEETSSLEAARDAVHAKAADLERFDKQVTEAQKALGEERTRADAFGSLLLSRQVAVRALAAVRDSLVSGMWIESWEPGQVTIRYWKDRVKAASGKTPAESFVEKLKSKGNVEPTSVKIDKMSPIGEANSLCEQFTVKVSFK